MEKPHWDDDIDITDIITKEEKDPTRLSKKKKTKAGKQSDRKDNDGVDVDAMDADNPKDEEEWDGTEEMRKRKVQEYMDAIHGMDFNDMVISLRLVCHFYQHTIGWRHAHTVFLYSGGRSIAQSHSC